MEAIALSHAADQDNVTTHCRRALDATRQTAHPERAYWAARACLVSRTITDRDPPSIEQRSELAYPALAGNLGRDELKAAVKWRTGRPAEAFALLSANPDGEAASRLSLLLRAAIALAAGRRSDARDGLQRADAGGLPALSSHLRPWLNAEADILREHLSRDWALPGGCGLLDRTGSFCSLTVRVPVRVAVLSKWQISTSVSARLVVPVGFCFPDRGSDPLHQRSVPKHQREGRHFHLVQVSFGSSIGRAVRMVR